MRRRCCVIKLNSNLPLPWWNANLDRLELGPCASPICDGTMLGKGLQEAEQHQKQFWNLVTRKCENSIMCEFFGNHTELDTHVTQHRIPVGFENAGILRVTDQDSDVTDDVSVSDEYLSDG